MFLSLARCYYMYAGTYYIVTILETQQVGLLSKEGVTSVLFANCLGLLGFSSPLKGFLLCDFFFFFTL